MRYVISDIHGCYEEYRRLLEKIRFSDEDELYVLGDAVDRGPEPVKVLMDMMMRPNVIFILGNHEYMMQKVLGKLAVEVTEENVENHLTAEDLMDFSYWMQDGGGTTCEQFQKLPEDQQRELLDYLEDASIYEVADTEDTRYVLVHAGIHGFREDRPLEDYELGDFLFYRADYGTRYYASGCAGGCGGQNAGGRKTVLVTGHTPTMSIRSDGQPLVYAEKGHLAVDCGCVFGGKLAAVCLENGQVEYVDFEERQK